MKSGKNVRKTWVAVAQNVMDRIVQVEPLLQILWFNLYGTLGGYIVGRVMKYPFSLVINVGHHITLLLKTFLS